MAKININSVADIENNYIFYNYKINNVNVIFILSTIY